MSAEFSIRDHILALKRATDAGDDEAAAAIRGQLIEAQRTADAALYNPTSGMSGTEKFWAGVGQGLTNVGRQAGNIVGLTSDEDLNEARARDAALLATGAGRAGSFVGESAAFAPIGMGVGGAIARSGGIGARLVGNAIGRGAVEGAAQGALMAGPGERGAGALTGGIAGAALPAAYKGWKGVTRGIAPTKDAARLMARGVDLTPGQMNPHSALGQIEESVRAVPVLGQVAEHARDRSYDQFKRLLASEALAPGAQLRTASADVGDLASAVKHGFDAAYAPGKGFEVGAKIMQTGPDIPLSKAFDAIGQKARLGLTDADRLNTVKVFKDHLTEAVKAARTSRRGLQSDDLLTLRSMVRENARDVDLATTGGRAMRKMLGEIEGKITSALDSQLPPSAMQAVRAADAQYGKFKILQDASWRGGARAHGMTAHDLAQSVKAAVPKGSYATGGGGAMRDLSDAATQVFTNRQPMTGRQAVTLSAPVAGLLAVGGAPAVGTAAAGLAGLIGTQTGRSLARGGTSPQLLARSLERGIKQLSAKEQREVQARLARGLLVAGAR